MTLLKNQSFSGITLKMLVELSAFKILKRIFDFIFAALLLTVLAPMLALITIVIFLETESNPFYSQTRGLTLEGNLFRIFKFRTLKECRKDYNDSSSILIKNNLSNYLTRTGSILRKTGLDEFPQLINIILGEMSFIGPRPLSLDDLVEMQKTEAHFYRRRKLISSKPGISGYWQINGKRTEGIKNLIELEEYYEKNKSFLFDFTLILKTIPVILLAKHSDAIVNKYIYEFPSHELMKSNLMRPIIPPA